MRRYYFNKMADRPSPAPRSPLSFVHSDEQWDAVSSAPRQEILQLLASRAPCSLAELALLLDCPPDGLYHHVKRLLAAGLIRETGRRAVGTRVESLYDLAADRLRLDVDIPAARNAPRLLRLFTTLLDRAAEHLGRAIASRAARIEEPFPDTLAESMTVWLDDDDLARLHQHLDAIRRLLDSRRSLRKGRLMSLTTVLTPVLRARNAQHRPTQRLATLKNEAENPAASHHSRRAKPLRRN